MRTNFCSWATRNTDFCLSETLAHNGLTDFWFRCTAHRRRKYQLLLCGWLKGICRLLIWVSIKRDWCSASKLLLTFTGFFHSWRAAIPNTNFWFDRRSGTTYWLLISGEPENAKTASWVAKSDLLTSGLKIRRWTERVYWLLKIEQVYIPWQTKRIYWLSK